MVNALALDPATGALAPIGAAVLLPRGAFDDGVVGASHRTDIVRHILTIDRAGQHLVISRDGDAKITTVAIDPVTGTLGAAVDSDAGGIPLAIVSAAK